jgi:hypothetical protein
VNYVQLVKTVRLLYLFGLQQTQIGTVPNPWVTGFRSRCLSWSKGQWIIRNFLFEIFFRFFSYGNNKIFPTGKSWNYSKIVGEMEDDTSCFCLKCDILKGLTLAATCRSFCHLLFFLHWIDSRETHGNYLD